MEVDNDEIGREGKHGASCLVLSNSTPLHTIRDGIVGHLGWLVAAYLSPTSLSDPLAITLHCDQQEGGGVWPGCVVAAVKAMRWGRGPAVVVLNRRAFP